MTHTLVGAGLSRAGLERRTPLATATLVVAANAPDVDVLSFAGGEYYALAFRRGITHGWPALLLLPFVIAGVFLAWDRWVRLRRNPDAEPARAGALLALSCIGVSSHPTLDWMNSYGMRWGLPFDPRWSYGDSLFIIDPWIWIVLGGALYLSRRREGRVLLPWAAGAVLATPLVVYGGGAGVAAVWTFALIGIALLGRRGRASPLAPAAALAAVSVYAIALTVASRSARGLVRDAAIETGLAVEDVMVAPVPARPLSSEVEVRTSTAYVPGSFVWAPGPRIALDLERAVPHLTAPPGLAPEAAEEIVAVASSRADVAHYLTWSRYPYVRVTADGTGWTVAFSDARYDARPEVDAAGLSGVTTRVDEDEIR